ncbi:hypothetical protein PQX77_002099 [Marasmius sp. AFHP31]|nr:hypothetical protein PQX77_002099 [Marasmius sp. AFHP31]
MSRMSFFDQTLKPTLFNPSFVAANVINNNYTNTYPERSDSPQSQSRLLYGRPSGHNGSRLKTIDVGDIILRREVSSRVIDVMTKPNEKGRALKLTNPFRARVIRQRQARFTKVRRTVNVAEILQFGDRLFTVVQFEAEDPRDREQLVLAFPQLFAAGSSEIPTLIYHDELVSAFDIMEEHTESPVVSTYLDYLHVLHQTVTFHGFDERFLAKISARLSTSRRDWLFNLRTGTFQFDLTSNQGLSSVDSYHLPHCSEPTALSSNAGMNPPLVPQLIIQHLENYLPDYLMSVSSLGETRYIKNLPEFTVIHPYLVMGSVINVKKPGIIGHFSPSDVNFGATWTCEVSDYDVDLDSHQFYESGYHRVDLSYSDETEPVPIHMVFTSQLTHSKIARLSCLGLLSGHLDEASDRDDLAFVDEIGFALYGTFESNPLTYPTPVYLFVPPVTLEQKNGVPILALPLPHRLFYWSLDPEGKTYISKKDWEEYKIPTLKAELWLGTFWPWWGYEAVDEFFRQEKHDSQTYAKDRGYPVLQEWQDNRFSVVEEDVKFIQGANLAHESQYSLFAFAGYLQLKLSLLQKLIASEVYGGIKIPLKHT